MKELEEWILDFISKNPDKTFNSIYRNACFHFFIDENKSDFQEVSLFLTINKLKRDGIIIQTNKDNKYIYYNLSLQLQRDKILNQIIK